MASAFASGFRLGGDMYNQSERNRMARDELELRRAADARAAAESAQRLEEGGLRLGAARRVDDATSALTNAQTFGIALPDNQRANEAMQRESLRRFEIGQQNADAAGDQAPAYMAPTGLQPAYRPATALDTNDLQMRLAASRGDVAGMESLRTGRRQIGIQDVTDRAARMRDEEIADLFPNLNSRALSGLPVYDAGDVLGKDGKPTGYRTIRTIGKDGKPNLIDLSPAQQREMAAAYMLMQAGYGTEGLARLSGVSKDLAETVAKYNQSITGATNSNNQVTRFANADAKDQEELGIKRDELGIKRDTAAAQRSYYQARIAAEKMGTAQYFNGEDGNTYAVVPKMGSDGKVTMETSRINPEGVKLKKPGGEGGGKPVKIEEAGTRVTIDGKPVQSDGMGGYIAINGILPDERPKHLKTLGVPDNLIEQLPWSADGRSVGFAGRAYDLTGRNAAAEAKALVEDFKRLNRNEIEADEDRKRSLGLHRSINQMYDTPAPGPRQPGTFRGNDPRMPPLSAPPEVWGAYRRLQEKERNDAR